MSGITGYGIAFYIKTLGSDNPYFHHGDIRPGIFPDDVCRSSFRCEVNRHVSIGPVLYESVAGRSWRTAVAVCDYFLIPDPAHNNPAVFKASFLG